MCHLDFITILVIFHVGLSGLHKLLEIVHEKTKSLDRIYRIIGYLLTCLEWIMAARTGKKWNDRSQD